MPISPSITRSLICFTGLLCTLNGLAIAEQGDASEFVAFYQEQDKDCEEKGGVRIFVKNTHGSQIIDLQIDRYFYDVRQAGRSMFPLRPAASQALGCSRVFDAEQRWELIAADFISEARMNERYGDYE